MVSMKPLYQKILCPGANLLSRNRTTIGPRELNCRVRDGNGCDLSGRSTKTKDSFFCLFCCRRETSLIKTLSNVEVVVELDRLVLLR